MGERTPATEIVDLKTINTPDSIPDRCTRGLNANRVFNTSVVRYSYNSLVTPNSVFDYDMNTGKSTLLKQTEVPGGVDRTNYKSERVFATASDGTKIPMSMVYRK
jgi:oligopeptidase B